MNKVDYSLDKWRESKWQKNTRFYSLSLCQNIWGTWIIKKTWGSIEKKGFGQSKDLICSDYPSALETYHKLQQKREKRGYQKIE